jgi:kinesin family protein 2/24
MIDLAGSERGVDNPNASTSIRREGAAINRSLLALKECIRALNGNDDTYIPFRSSKLTCVLRDCFRNGHCVMMLNISPTSATVEQTLSCLHYANRVKEYSSGKGAAGVRVSLSRYKTPEDLIQVLDNLAPNSGGPSNRDPKNGSETADPRSQSQPRSQEETTADSSQLNSFVSGNSIFCFTLYHPLPPEC